MMPYWLLIAVLLPILAGGLLLVCKRLSDRAVKLYTILLTLLTSALVWTLILSCSEDGLQVMPMLDTLTVLFRFDGLGRFFAGIVATLWPLTVLYAFEYMADSARKRSFFAFFTMSYGATLGVAMAGNLFTMYLFYELLTLATLPLVMHTLSRQAVRAARLYFAVSLGGAALGFAAMVFLAANGAGGAFAFGGLLHDAPNAEAFVTQLFYVLGFVGFGVKAAIFPLHLWLIRASVAPTPVTALLHAVAVVKAGAFAIIRLTFFSFDPAILQGTWAQTLVMALALLTIFYGASMAVKERHWKRRMAYSTVANLSYILFAVSLMTPEGLSAGLLHTAFHANIKILAFFCVGAVMHQTGREYVSELEGLGRRMPLTFTAFTVSALALVGIPPLSGFVSKWSLLTAAANADTPLGYLGVGVLIAAALLTAIYMFTTAAKAWFPAKGRSPLPAEIREAGWKMLVPMGVLTVSILACGLFAQPIVDATLRIAQLG